jgi:hypothetical protein
MPSEATGAPQAPLTKAGMMQGHVRRLAVLSALLVGSTLAACASPGEAAGAAVGPPADGGGQVGDPPHGGDGGGAGAGLPQAGWASVMDFGAVGDGIHDDTSAFQAAANTGKTVWVPRPPAFYQVTAPIHLSASIIGDYTDLANMPLIRMQGSNGDGYHTTLIVRGYHGAEQLVIAGLQIDNQYVDTTQGGEWDHNITISDSNNVRVTTNRLLNAWGDGVCIGEWKRAPSNPEIDSINIVVENNYIHNPFRCTVAPLFTSTGTVIRNNYHRKLNRSDNGTNIPVIDIEPDGGPQGSIAWDVLIEDNVVDAHTSDGASVHFIWEVESYSSAPDPVRGTRARNNRGYWGGLSNTALAEDTNNVFMDPPPPWQMKPFPG